MLTPDGSLLVTIILFLALVPILNRILFQPITTVLNERDRLTNGSETDAEAILSTIDRKLTAYEEGIRAARSEGYEVIERRRAAAMSERQSMITDARETAERKIADARAQIGADAEAARTTLESDAREIAAKISSTLLGRAVGGAR